MAMIHPPGVNFPDGGMCPLLGSSVTYCQAGIFLYPFPMIPFVRVVILSSHFLSS